MPVLSETSFVLFVCSFVCLLLPESLSEEVLGKTDNEFDFDGLPGAQHEFKVDVPAGYIECFYQNIRKGATLHVSFEVLRGADKNVDFLVKKPDGQIFDAQLWTHEGVIDKETEEAGVYELCIDNSFSRFSDKLVFVYIVTYVPQDWEHYAKELESLQVSITNFTSSISKVDKDISKMATFQATSRKHVISDWYTVISNNKMVRNWCIAMSCLAVATSGFQTFFVRRLFSVPNVTPSAKPRA